jgi:hypothetical protein
MDKKSYYLNVRKLAREELRQEEMRFKRQQRRKEEIARAYGDLCEATDGEAALWLRNGYCSFDMAYMLACDRWTKICAERYFKLSGKKNPMARSPKLGNILSSLVLSHFIVCNGASPAMRYCALVLLIKATGKSASTIKHKAIRPKYYEKENIRRRELARERRRILSRTTISDCPSKEAILDAFMHRKDSKEAAIHLGSLIHDLECYVDNELRFDRGKIIGRNAGIKGWLGENIPLLLQKYSTIMRYKAMAKKLKQLVELDDPMPAEVVLINETSQSTEDSVNDNSENEITVRNKNCIVDEVLVARVFRGFKGGKGDKFGDVNKGGMDETGGKSGKGGSGYNGGMGGNGYNGGMGGNGYKCCKEERLLRAIAIYKEISEGVVGASQMMARIDAFLDPERVEEATTLAFLREKYQNEITVRNKSKWWRRLIGRVKGRLEKQVK